MSKNPFPVSLPRTEIPRLRGTQQRGKGKTPLYYLAWRVDPLDIRSGCDYDAFADDFVDKWNAIDKPVSGTHKRPQPFFQLWLGGLEDEDVYFVVATNNRDPKTITEEDIQYAKAALPEFFPQAKVDLDSDEVFRWYRKVNF
ncbi:hypothetical protein HMN09_01146700 [Mycena chlorophos]|uniref:Uncharacterized protein n=1 Tax=Mycena chlorophos TaxID=658473 RepID=A0A8H6VXU9_MYCCL|nr:hypothetical protein HMN09_01146700 [Mycena chlorophos]